MDVAPNHKLRNVLFGALVFGPLSILPFMRAHAQNANPGASQKANSGANPHASQTANQSASQNPARTENSTLIVGSPTKFLASPNMASLSNGTTVRISISGAPLLYDFTAPRLSAATMERVNMMDSTSLSSFPASTSFVYLQYAYVPTVFMVAQGSRTLNFFTRKGGTTRPSYYPEGRFVSEGPLTGAFCASPSDERNPAVFTALTSKTLQICIEDGKIGQKWLSCPIADALKLESLSGCRLRHYVSYDGKEKEWYMGIIVGTPTNGYLVLKLKSLDGMQTFTQHSSTYKELPSGLQEIYSSE